MAGKKGPRLKSIADISLFMARIIRETYRGELDPSVSSKLGYLCNIHKSCLEMSDIEQRLEKLESSMQRKSDLNANKNIVASNFAS
jgi:hypothetical protein